VTRLLLVAGLIVIKRRLWTWGRLRPAYWR